MSDSACFDHALSAAPSAPCPNGLTNAHGCHCPRAGTTACGEDAVETEQRLPLCATATFLTVDCCPLYVECR